MTIWDEVHSFVWKRLSSERHVRKKTYCPDFRERQMNLWVVGRRPKSSKYHFYCRWKEIRQQLFPTTCRCPSHISNRTYNVSSWYQSDILPPVRLLDGFRQSKFCQQAVNSPEERSYSSTQSHIANPTSQRNQGKKDSEASFPATSETRPLL